MTLCVMGLRKSGACKYAARTPSALIEPSRALADRAEERREGRKWVGGREQRGKHSRQGGERTREIERDRERSRANKSNAIV